MLELSAEQTSSLQQAAREAFIDEMAAHLAAFSPPHARALGVAGLRPVIGVGMDRAANHGLTWRGPVRLYLELMCLFGSFFADDPQLPAPARAVLADQACDQLERAQALRRILSGHFAHIFGQQGPGRREVLTRLRDRVGEPPPVRGPRPEDALLALLAEVWPEKAAVLPAPAREQLAAQAIRDAQTWGLGSARGQALFFMLALSLGHRCLEDPLYPWIARTLGDARLTAGNPRGAALTHWARAWFDLLLAALPGA